METTSRKWLSLAIVLTAPLLSVIDVFIVNIAIPTMQRSLQASDAQMQLVVAGYLLGYASFMVSGGRAGDQHGRRKVFFRSMLAFTITSAGCGLAQTPDQLNGFRFFQGVSASFMIPQTVSYIQLLFDSPRERTKAFGLYGMTLGLASVLGQFLGGYFSSGEFFITGWRLIFYINVPVGLLSLWTIYRFLPETPVHMGESFDYSGTALLILSLISFIYPLVQGREAGWPAWCFLSIGISLVTTFIFVRNQQTKSRLQLAPLIDTTLFSFADFKAGLMAVVGYFVFHTSYLFVSTLHFQKTLHLSALRTGICFVYFGVGFTLASLLSIKLVNRFGKRALLIGVSLIISMLVIEIITFEQAVEPLILVSTLFLQGMGMGMVLPSLMNFALRSVPPRLAGAASGVYSTFQQVASALGITLVGSLYFYVAESTDIPERFYLAYQLSLGADIGFLILLSFALLLLPSHYPPAPVNTALTH